MKKSILLVAIVLAFAGFGKASTCAVGDFGASSYGAPGFSCTLGDLTFSDFSYIPSGSNQLTGDQVTVTPTTAGGEVGFIFSGAWSVKSDQSSDSLIGYTVTSPTESINDLVLSISGYGFTGTGFVAVTENADNGTNLYVCFGDPTCEGLQTDSATFGAVSSLTITKDISVIGGGEGTASLSAVVNGVSEVPEPATLSLLGTGLLGLAGMVRRKLRS